MFVVFVRTRRRTQRNHLSLWKIFKTSRFYFSFLLVGSFVMLTVVPSIYLFILLESGLYSKSIKILDACYLLSSTVDVFLYVFAQRKVREMFIKKMCCCFRSCTTNRNRNRRNEVELRILSAPLTNPTTTLNPRNESIATIAQETET